MTASAFDLLFYAGAVLVLFATPGPVWVALTARALSGGFASAWPLAVGVTLGDLMWPLLAIFGMSWVVANVAGAMLVMRWVAAAMFLGMGALLIHHAGRPIAADGRLTRPGRMAGFLAGLAAILGNPKAILFYMGVLPGFFDLSRVTGPDIVAIIAVSGIIPLFGNLGLALFLDRARRLLSSPQALARLNRVSGALLILVGMVIPFT